MSIKRAVMDLHCDTLTDGLQRGYSIGGNSVHVDLLRPPEGMGWCQTFAIFIPDNLRGQAAWNYFDVNYRHFLAELERYKDIAAQARTSGEIRRTLEQGKIAAVLSIEGGAALMGDPDKVREAAARGVKFLTLTWNAANEIAGGAAAEIGLTPVGEEILAAMEEAGVVADVSHLNDRSFWDVARVAKKPFVATHSDSRAVCNHPRNLTDDQFREMVQVGGLVGINLCTEFLSKNGAIGPGDTQPGGRVAVPGKVLPEELLRHLLHFLELGGEDVICMGADFDGATVPDFLPGADAFPVMEQLLLGAGLGPALTHKILFQNAFDFCARYEALS